MSWLGLWWHQSDHYDRLSAHLQARGMDTLTRATISLIGVALALVSVGTIWSGTGPRGVVQVSCALAGGSGALIATLI
jgi:hypothetical protein